MNEIQDTGHFPSDILYGEEKIFDPSEIPAVQVCVKLGHCHDNILLLWAEVHEIEVWTGRALDLHGEWVSHSWGWHPEYEMLIETTIPFVKYIGKKVSGSFLFLETQQAAEHKARLGIDADLKKLLWDKTHKTCAHCREEKLILMFRVDRGYVRSECKPCAAAYRKEHYAKDPQKYAAVSRKWSKENPEKRNAMRRAWCAKNPEKHNASRRKTMYGLLDVDFKEMLSAQGNKCAVCSREFTKTCRKDTPHVDHCHTTGKIRGLLCGPCNSGIGHLQDSLLVILNAAEYLKKYS